MEDSADSDTGPTRDEIWLRHHRKWVLVAADEYVRVLPEPQSQSLYLGRTDVVVTDSAVPQR